MFKGSKIKANKRRREPLTRKHKGKIAFLAKAFAVVTVFSLFAVASWRFYHELLRSPSLEIKTINIDGKFRVSVEEIMELTGVHIGKNILSVRPFSAEKALKTHPFVEEANVKIILPRTINIALKEREPALLVNLDGLYVMDKKGVLFKKYSPEDSIDVPVVTGLDDFGGDMEPIFKAGLFPLLAALNESPVLVQFGVSEINANPAYGFTITTVAGGVRVRVGKDGFGARLNDLDKIISGRAAGFAGLESIDLTGERGVVVRFLATSTLKRGNT
ncbi:MAG: FtsQ-type POTRA domain-containing protein [Thermodesulfobacteriota bacterium]